MRYQINWAPARVTRIEDVARSIRLFEIAPEAGPLHAPPGAHLNVSLILNGRPETRSYSIVATDSTAYRIAVKLCADSRGGSRAMFDLTPGARLAISEPHNNFALDFDRSDYLLIAGGIGVTPIVAMAAALARAGKTYRLVHVSPTRAEAAFGAELAAAHGARYAPYYSREGAPLDLAAAIAELGANGQVYFCGPMRMLDAARRVWAAAERPQADLRFETFASGGRYAAEAFTVKIPRLAVEIRVAENETMLAALTKAGVEVMSDCQRGECGLCAVTILGCEGAVDHRDVFFSERERAEGGKLCACVSRAVGGAISIDTAYRACAEAFGS